MWEYNMIKIKDAKMTATNQGKTRYWSCLLVLTDDNGIDYNVNANLPLMPRAALDQYAEENEPTYWSLVEDRDIITETPTKKLLRAVALVYKDEINILREQHNLPERTTEEIILAVISKLED
jgi:hypothetical protein